MIVGFDPQHARHPSESPDPEGSGFSFTPGLDCPGRSASSEASWQPSITAGRSRRAGGGSVQCTGRAAARGDYDRFVRWRERLTGHPCHGEDRRVQADVQPQVMIEPGAGQSALGGKCFWATTARSIGSAMRSHRSSLTSRASWVVLFRRPITHKDSVPPGPRLEESPVACRPGLLLADQDRT
jgi:hypothetical protein